MDKMFQPPSQLILDWCRPDPSTFANPDSSTPMTSASYGTAASAYESGISSGAEVSSSEEECTSDSDESITMVVTTDNACTCSKVPVPTKIPAPTNSRELVSAPGTFLPPPGLEDQSPYYSTEEHLKS